MNVYKMPKLILTALDEDDATTGAALSAGALDFVKTPSGFSDAYSLIKRKSGANLITVTQLGSDDGFNDVGGPTFTWGADATNGGAGSGGSVHWMSTQTAGNGVRFSVPITAALGCFQRRLRLRVWDTTYSLRQTTSAASIIGDSGAVPVSDGMGPVWEENGLTDLDQRLTTVLFFGEPGTTLRLDLTRNATSMGNWGWSAAKLDLVPNGYQRKRGAMRHLLGFAR